MPYEDLPIPPSLAEDLTDILSTIEKVKGREYFKALQFLSLLRAVEIASAPEDEEGARLLGGLLTSMFQEYTEALSITITKPVFLEMKKTLNQISSRCEKDL